VETVWGGYVQAVWSGAGPGPSQLGWNRWTGEAERSIVPGGGTGSPGRVEQVNSGPPWWTKAGCLGKSLPSMLSCTAKSSE
jgi:hypothetical protein